jgi:hypothetical protein
MSNRTLTALFLTALLSFAGGWYAHTQARATPKPPPPAQDRVVTTGKLIASGEGAWLIGPPSPGGVEWRAYCRFTEKMAAPTGGTRVEIEGNLGPILDHVSFLDGCRVVRVGPAE